MVSAPSSSTGRSNSERRQTRGEKTRDRLLVAGAKVFARHGYHAARVDDIVKAASTSHGTFYLYFGSKEVLFESLMDTIAEEFVQLVEQIPPAIDGTPAHRADFDRWLAALANLSVRVGPMMNVWATTDTTAESPRGRVTNALVERLSASIAAGPGPEPSPEPLDIEIAVTAIWAMFERLCQYIGTGQLDVRVSELVDITSDIFFDTLRFPS